MRKTYAFIFFIVALLFATQSFAQLSVNVGYANRTMNSHYYRSNSKVPADEAIMPLGNGFYAGFTYNYALSKEMGVSAGLYYTYSKKIREGSSESSSGVLYEVKEDTTMKDINLPILFNYKYCISDDLSLFAFAGPNIQVGISALVKQTIKTSGYPDRYMNGTHHGKLELYEPFEGGGAGFTRFDVGAMVGLGVQYKHIRLEAGYNMGLLERTRSKDRNGEVLRWNFNLLFVGVGYTF